MLARLLSVPSGRGAAERLGRYLSGDPLACAVDAAGNQILVVDDAPSGARDIAERIASLRGFAALERERLIAIAPRSVLAAIAADGNAIAVELLRAADASLIPALVVPLARRTLDFTRAAGVMGILNVTPDSFYDKGRYTGIDVARARANEMVEQGAAVIDIGGQSYAHWNPRIAAEEEVRRVVPVVEALVREGLDVALSIDTFKATVADAALAAGADIINDCSGLADPAMAATVARYDAGYVAMHLKGELNVRSESYEYDDAMAEILAFLHARVETVAAAGVKRERIMIDPGLEFGKEPRTDLEILDYFGDQRSLGQPILFAASRKSFIGRVFHRPHKELLVPSLATAAIGVLAGACLVRVHDVAETVELCRMLGAVRADVRDSLDIAAAIR